MDSGVIDVGKEGDLLEDLAFVGLLVVDNAFLWEWVVAVVVVGEDLSAL